MFVAKNVVFCINTFHIVILCRIMAEPGHQGHTLLTHDLYKVSQCLNLTGPIVLIFSVGLSHNLLK